MTKNFRAVKISIVLGILVVSIFTSLIPSASAGILTTNVDVKMNYDASAASQKVVPLQGEITIQINISIQIQGVFANLYQKLLQGRTSASVDLSIGETPSWASALITPNVVTPEISTTWGVVEKAYVHISFDENAPAHMPLTVEIKMHASVPGSLGLVNDVTKSAYISFTPSYLPIIDATPRATFIEVSPGQIAGFNIDLENLGNAETEFILTIVSAPKNWVATIPANVIVPSAIGGGNSKKAVQLTVQPPYNFGYHNEKVQIIVGVKGRYYAGGASLETDTYQHTFTVQNRGFSTPGFETAFALLALVGLALFIKKQRKIR